MTDLDLDELRKELDEFAKPNKQQTHSAREERIIAGFEEIQRFVEEHGHVPQSGEDKDIFERIYAARLDQIRKQPECYELVTDIDTQDLLKGADQDATSSIEELDDEELLAELEGIGSEVEDLKTLNHVRPRAEIRAAEQIAKGKRCEDFEIFKPKFEAVQQDLKEGLRKTEYFRKNAGFVKTDVKVDHFIILGGQTCYIAEVGETFKAPNGEDDARLRVIYSNGTESDILLRTIIRAMYRDAACRLISNPSAGPLFSNEKNAGDSESGTIFVLRSKSDLPFVTENRKILHKIGVTGGDVQKRIAGAAKEATFLLADVEVVATYELYNINRGKMEQLIHKVFHAARVDIEIKDRFGEPVEPREWFLVPLFIIDEAINKIKDETIKNYIYDIETSNFILRANS
jgi:hypothetical protein